MIRLLVRCAVAFEIIKFGFVELIEYFYVGIHLISEQTGKFFPKYLLVCLRSVILNHSLCALPYAADQSLRLITYGARAFESPSKYAVVNSSCCIGNNVPSKSNKIAFITVLRP